MSRPVVSVILSAAYPEKWIGMYASLQVQNATSFEIIFVGPNAPTYEMPPSTKFIQTDVNPVQCKEIAFRASVGHYVLDLADDFLFVPQFLNSMVAHTIGHDMNKKIIIGHLGHKWKAKVLGKHHLGHRDLPIIGLLALIKRSVWEKLGGLERRLKAIYYNDDLALRFYQAGGSYILGDPRTCLANEQGVNALSRLSRAQDEPTILKLWSVNGEFTPERQSVLCPFSDEDILTRNQIDDEDE